MRVHSKALEYSTQERDTPCKFYQITLICIHHSMTKSACSCERSICQARSVYTTVLKKPFYKTEGLEGLIGLDNFKAICTGFDIHDSSLQMKNTD